MRYFFGILLLLQCSIVEAVSKCDFPRRSARDAGVVIGTGEGKGSGVVIAPGLVLTAAHVVLNNDGTHPDVVVTGIPSRETSNVAKREVTDYAISDDYDLALLKTDTTGRTSLGVLQRPIYDGERTFHIGYAGGNRIQTPAEGRFWGTMFVKGAVHITSSLGGVAGISGAGALVCDEAQGWQVATILIATSQSPIGQGDGGPLMETVQFSTYGPTNEQVRDFLGKARFRSASQPGD